MLTNLHIEALGQIAKLFQINVRNAPDTYMILGMFAEGQLGLPEGGSLNLVLPIKKRCRDLGGQVTYKANVEEVLVDNDLAVGVRLSGSGGVHQHYCPVMCLLHHPLNNYMCWGASRRCPPTKAPWCMSLLGLMPVAL